MIHLHRPRTEPPSIFDEISGGDLDNRWRACVALTAEVWGCGLRACTCQAERTEWLGRTTDYFTTVRKVFIASHVSTTEPLNPDAEEQAESA